MATTILVVDDSATMRKVLEMTFASEDARVLSFPSGDAALQQIGDIKPDVVIADSSMSAPDGYDIARMIRQNASTAHIPVLLLASQHNPYDSDRGRASGVDDYISKPFDSQAMVDRVQQVLARPRSVVSHLPTDSSLAAGGGASIPGSSVTTGVGSGAKPGRTATVMFGSQQPPGPQAQPVHVGGGTGGGTGGGPGGGTGGGPGGGTGGGLSAARAMASGTGGSVTSAASATQGRHSGPHLPEAEPNAMNLGVGARSRSGSAAVPHLTNPASSSSPAALGQPIGSAPRGSSGKPILELAEEEPLAGVTDLDSDLLLDASDSIHPGDAAFSQARSGEAAGNRANGANDRMSSPRQSGTHGGVDGPWDARNAQQPARAGASGTSGAQASPATSAAETGGATSSGMGDASAGQSHGRPGLDAAQLQALGLTASQIQAVLALSREVIEKVVWEVVPELAETIIREEIRRITRE